MTHVPQPANDNEPPSEPEATRDHGEILNSVAATMTGVGISLSVPMTVAIVIAGTTPFALAIPAGIAASGAAWFYRLARRDD